MLSKASALLDMLSGHLENENEIQRDATLGAMTAAESSQTGNGSVAPVRTPGSARLSEKRNRQLQMAASVHQLEETILPFLAAQIFAGMVVRSAGALYMLASQRGEAPYPPWVILGLPAFCELYDEGLAAATLTGEKEQLHMG